MEASQTLVRSMEKREQADSKKEVRTRYLKLRDQIPEDVRSKYRGTLCRVVNEGANGLICLIL